MHCLSLVVLGFFSCWDKAPWPKAGFIHLNDSKS